MGKRGPAPRTDGEKSLAGIALVPVEVGECPVDMSDDAKECFNRLKPLVEQQGMVTSTDRETFIQYCREWGVFSRLDRACIDAPLTVPTKDGVKANPVFGTRNASSATLVRLADKLGLTPACRARMKIEPGDTEETDEEKEQFGT